MASRINEHQQKVVTKILFCPSEERTVRELQQLPSVDREQVWADMMGNPESTYYRIHAEDPAFVQLCLDKLSKELNGSSSSTVAGPTGTGGGGRSSFDKAVQQDPLYVSRQRIKFLRAENFDTSAAANRMLAFFQKKEELFGSNKLGRDILLSDLNDDDMMSLRAGGMQILPLRDHATRGVVFTRNRNYRYRVQENQLRALFYISQCISSDEHYQKVGLVSVSYQVGGYPKQGYDFELTRKVSKLVRCVPVRFSAIYLCYSLSPWKQVADLISHIVSPFLRVRLRSLQGSHQECLYNLMALGIPYNVIPVNDQGEELLNNHLQWIKHRREVEEENNDII